MADILLAAKDGAAYIEAQIASVLAQDDPNWRLIIRDDGSADNTFAIAESYANRYPGRIFAYKAPFPSGSAKDSFFSLMPFAESDYILFCDQDDVWLPDKLSRSMAEMRRLENLFGRETPLLVHTDLKVADETLSVLHPSFFRMQRFNTKRNKLQNALVQNVATGCTVLVNRPLLSLAGSSDPAVIMHDWWLYLIAAAFGQVGTVDVPTVLYRQHGNNAVGAKKMGESAKSLSAMKASIHKTYRQGEVFAARFGDRLSPKEKKVLDAFTGLPTCGKCRRIYTLFRYGFWKHSLLRKLGQIIAI